MKNSLQTLFECSHCGAQYTKWAGRCTQCGKWGSIPEEGSRSMEQGTKNKNDVDYPAAKTVTFGEVQKQDVKRASTNIGELDRVLGGGIVPGSLILLGGEPGIGKSTLALQCAATVANTLYISGEESIGQIKLRADRLKITAPTLQLANETNVETIVSTIRQASATTPNPSLSSRGGSALGGERRGGEVSPPARGGVAAQSGRGGGSVSPNLVIIDSIQTIFSAEADGEAGSPTQIRACTVKLLEAAKGSNIPVIIIGHVTKEGVVAGPKTLEHLVDTVLYLEGERHHFYRVLRTVKNRFGSTDEVGIFEMAELGLVEVKNPSASFLSERGDNLPGNVVTCLMEGTRPLLVEVQALVNKTAFGYPVRKASGFDINRLHLLIAVLQKRAGLHLEQYDVHLNIAGGITADEPAADLAVAMAVASAYKDKALGHDLCVFGEVGLGGEVRPTGQAEKRIKECENLGMQRVITNLSAKSKVQSQKVRVLNVKNLEELIKQA